MNLSHAPRRRRHLLDADEPLIHPMDPVTLATRLTAFCADTGVDPATVALPHSGATPVPLTAGSPRGVPGLRPSGAWHPLFWLPDSLTSRVAVVRDGQVHVETDDEWGVRVLLVMALAGLHDADGWADVLDLAAGLDVDAPDDLARVTRWLDGDDDPDLDTVDLGSLIPTVDIDTLVGDVADTLAAIRPAERWITAESLVELIDSAAGMDPHDACRQVLALAAVGFSGDEDHRGEAQVWTILATATDDDLPDPDRLLRNLRSNLADIGNRYAPAT